MTSTKMIRRITTNTKKGFTLVELVVVIAILGILSAIAIPTVISMINSASEAAEEETAHSINEACRNYYTGVLSGIINSTNQGGSTQTLLPGARSTKTQREVAADKATVVNACEYAGLTDVVAKLNANDTSFGYTAAGEVVRSARKDVGSITYISSTTTLGGLYS